jgi:hypothetical protein
MDPVLGINERVGVAWFDGQHTARCYANGREVYRERRHLIASLAART